MNLSDARLCLDCEEIHDAPRCPACGSDYFFPLERWLNRSVRESNAWIDAIINFRAEQPATAEGRSQPSLEGTG